MTFPILLPCWSDWSSYYHFNYSGYRWRLLRDGRRWRSPSRSEERFSRNAETDLVCRLLLEKKKKKTRSIFFFICTILSISSFIYHSTYSQSHSFTHLRISPLR